MWPDVVVVVAPDCQFTAGVCQAVEYLLVQAFIAQAAVEALDLAILLWLSGVDVVPLDAVVVGPFQDGLAGEFGAIVRGYAGGFSVDPDQCVQFPRDPSAGDAGIGNQAEIFTAAIIVHRQNAELPAIPEGVGKQVQPPALVRLQRHWHRSAAAPRPFAATTAAHRQALFPVNPVELLFVHHHAHTFQHDTDPPPLTVCKQTVAGQRIAKPMPLLSDLVHFQTDPRVVGRMLVPHGLGIDTDQGAGPALRDRMTRHRPQYRVPPLHRRR